MIRAINGKGVHRAKVICDNCGREEVVCCDYMPRRGGKREPHEGQISKKMERLGWQVSGGKHECPTCVAHRRAFSIEQEQGGMAVQERIEPEAAHALRQPSGLQKRLIVLAIEDVWDSNAGRYRSGCTDKTVADELGDGILFGWVAAIREEMFGPDGSNEEIEALQSDLTEALDGIAQAKVKFMQDVATILKAQEGKIEPVFAEFGRQLSSLQRRVEAVRVAVGPRAGRS